MVIVCMAIRLATGAWLLMSRIARGERLRVRPWLPPADGRVPPRPTVHRIGYRSWSDNYHMRELLRWDCSVARSVHPRNCIKKQLLQGINSDQTTKLPNQTISLYNYSWEAEWKPNDKRSDAVTNKVSVFFTRNSIKVKQQESFTVSVELSWGT